MNDNDEVADYDDELYEEDVQESEGANLTTEEHGDGVKKRMQEMEEELDRLNKMQQQVEKQISTASDSLDEKSIYVGQVDYEATPEELRAHFAPCGTINRVTIMCDKITGHPKGFAYVEFVDKESVENALKLDESLFKGRQLKVLPKRQNLPVSAMRGRGRGRGPPIRGGRHFTRGRFGGRGRGGPVRGRSQRYYQNTYY